MAEEPKSIDVLEAQLTEISDTHKNLIGLIEKTTRIQSELMSAEFSDFADAVGEPFSAMSGAAEKLQELLHKLELERNRLKSEG